MRQLYLLLMFLLLPSGLFAANYPGFLVTKDGYKLTGYLNEISYLPTGNVVTFTNDFGDKYTIHPFLVEGFGFNLGGQSVRYVSRFHNGQWYFLEEEIAGQALTLYRLPTGNDRFIDDSLLRLFATPPPPYYFGYGKDKIFPIPRSGFRRAVREFFRESSPEFAAKIGTRGYRYRDLTAIVEEFNALRGRVRRRL